MRFGSPRRLTLAVGVGLVTLLATLTISASLDAQPRRGGRPAPPKPKAPAVVADAGAEEAATEEEKGSSANGTPGADAGPVPAPAGPASPPELYDGGLRPSPLNPAADEFPDGGPPPETVDYDKLLAEIASLRSRVAAVSDTLFHSRIAVAIETEGSHARIARLTVSVDDGIVYTAPPNFRADDLVTVYDHAVAPGRHAVTIEAERRDDRDETFRTTQRSRFVVDVPRDHKLDLAIRILDDSNMGADFPGDRTGRYELKVRAKASAKPIGR